MLCEHARKATTGVPKRYRHLSKVPKRCSARTVGHPKVIKGARHVPGPIRELTSKPHTVPGDWRWDSPVGPSGPGLGTESRAIARDWAGLGTQSR